MPLSKKDSDFRNKICAENAALHQQLADGETTYQVQNSGVMPSCPWHNFGTPTANRAEALTKAHEMRERYNQPFDGAWRVVQTISIITHLY